MAVLMKVLKDLKIKSIVDLNKYINSNNSGPLRVITADNAETILDYEVKENEIHKDLIEFSDIILDVEQLTFFPKDKIVFKNCILMGKVCINGRDGNLSDIEIDNCIFLNELIISGFVKMKNKNISIFHTNITCLSLFNIKSSELILTGCKIFFVSFHQIDANKFEAYNNYFKYFELENSNFKEVLFDHRQLDINSIGKRIIKNIDDFQFRTYTQLPKDINLFLFIPYETSVDLQKTESYNTILETIDFFKKSTTLSYDRNKYMQLMFYEVLLAQNKSVHKAFVRLTGGFLKPFSFISIAVFVFVFFALIYMFPMLEFSSAQNGLIHSLPIDQALYFSGITFTTIGYGDICPVGFSRVLAILEGIFGITIMSAFLVALVKKYID